eukprot:108789_1
MSKGHKKPKDLNAPKKNQSSYFIFSNERRPILQSQDKKRPVTDISKTISAEWKAMDPSTKKTYEEKAAQQKQKYKIAFEEYSKTDNYAKYMVKLAEWKEREKLMNRDMKRKGKPPKKPKQPESMPKRSQSSYFLFSNARRNQLRELYPEKKLTDLSKLIADEWKQQTAEEKAKYEETARQHKEKYVACMSSYKLTNDYTEYMNQLEQWKIAKKRWENGMNERLKVSLPRKPKDAQCPKRPLTSYFLYAKEVREATKQEFPNKSITEIAKEISKKWKVLTEDEKVSYNEEAARLKEVYKKQIQEYEGSDAQIEFKKKLEEWKVECDRRKTVAKEKAEKKELRELKKKEREKKKKKMPKKKRKVIKKKKVPTPMEVDSSSESESSSSDSDSDSDSDSESGSSSSGSESGSSSGSSSSD